MYICSDVRCALVVGGGCGSAWSGSGAAWRGGHLALRHHHHVPLAGTRALRAATLQVNLTAGTECLVRLLLTFMFHFDTIASFFIQYCT